VPCAWLRALALLARAKGGTPALPAGTALTPTLCQG